MPYYCSLGKIPQKRHTQFRKPDGGLYAEEVFGTEGFSSDSSILYHCNPPTKIIKIDPAVRVAPVVAEEMMLHHRSFLGFKIKPENDYLDSRKTILLNNDVAISLAAPQQSMKGYFYKNADEDEVIFVHEGKGKLKSMYGELPFGYGDYLVVPRGCIYTIEFETTENRLLIIESRSPVRFPKRYLSPFGQFLENSPFCERDIRHPVNLKTIEEKGDFLFKIKKGGMLYPIHYMYHPFDVVGWDGYCYPFAFSIHSFEPITGRIHQPPPVHQTFEGHNFVICSFVPRLYDYHPLSIPAPYNHSNIDSDEVLYYVDGQFMSRKRVERGMITLHPAGVPHGPQPGSVENSIGKKSTEELAVMMDTFRPLKLTQYALDIEDPNYVYSWIG